GTKQAGYGKTLSIANEFFYINDIQINVKKSNLIVFNPKTKVKERSITFGNCS
ncbi:22153_t:CDS:2, partial [Gigaspora margarita]